MKTIKHDNYTISTPKYTNARIASFDHHSMSNLMGNAVYLIPNSIIDMEGNLNGHCARVKKKAKTISSIFFIVCCAIIVASCMHIVLHSPLEGLLFISPLITLAFLISKFIFTFFMMNIQDIINGDDISADYMVIYTRSWIGFDCLTDDDVKRIASCDGDLEMATRVLDALCEKRWEEHISNNKKAVNRIVESDVTPSLTPNQEYRKYLMDSFDKQFEEALERP